MFTIFCCNNLRPFRPTRTDHEAKFTSFLEWAKFPTMACVVIPAAGAEKSQSLQESNWPYAIQLVKQVNYGPLESKRYFVPLDDNAEFKEITERDLIEANFAKVNSYKNFKCTSHNKFFELNLYQKDPVNRHHWRANIARPAADIDLDASSREQEELQVITPKSRVDTQAQIQKNTGDESNVVSVKPAPDFDDSIAGVLARIPKMGLEEATEGVSSTGLNEGAGRMSAIVPGDIFKEEEEEEVVVVDGDDNDEYYERDDYGYGSYDDETKDLDYTACSLECGYCGRCDY